ATAESRARLVSSPDERTPYHPPRWTDRAGTPSWHRGPTAVATPSPTSVASSVESAHLVGFRWTSLASNAPGERFWHNPNMGVRRQPSAASSVNHPRSYLNRAFK